ncbi:MAG: DMT family transporter [Hyphomicrobiaceae bacterium]
MTLNEWVMLIALAFVWGGTFFFNALAVRELPVFTVVVSRVVLAAIILITIMRWRSEYLPSDMAAWSAFLGIGLLNNVIPFSLIVWGQQHIASGLASILNASTPLFTVIFAHFLTRDERMSVRKFVGVLVGMMGVAVMIGIDALGNSGVAVVAQIVCLAAALSYALAGIFGRRFRSMGLSPMVTATGQVTASSIILVPVVLIVDRPWTLDPPSTTAIVALVCVAAVSTALAYVLYFRILATAGATNLLLVTFLIPVNAILLGIFVLGEIMLPQHFAGMALIGLGLAIIDGRLWSYVRRRPGDGGSDSEPAMRKG